MHYVRFDIIKANITYVKLFGQELTANYHQAS
jgi:hypothetical protein